MALILLPWPADVISQGIQAAVLAGQARHPCCRYSGFCPATPRLPTDHCPDQLARQAGALVTTWAPENCLTSITVVRKDTAKDQAGARVQAMIAGWGASKARQPRPIRAIGQLIGLQGHKPDAPFDSDRSQVYQLH